MLLLAFSLANKILLKQVPIMTLTKKKCIRLILCYINSLIIAIASQANLSQVKLAPWN